MKQLLRSGTRILGLLAIGVACWFLIASLRASWRSVAVMMNDLKVLWAVVGYSLIYATSLVLVATAWYLLVEAANGGGKRLVPALRIYAIANVAKYLPGNVFHFVGRQLLGNRAGWSHRAIAQSSVLELGIMVACALALVGILGGMVVPSDLWETRFPILIGIGEYDLLFTVLIMAGGYAVLAISERSGILRRFLGIRSRDLVMPGILITLFLAASGLIADALGMVLKGSTVPIPQLIIAVAYLASWLAGFVVPGAPGGLGVREGVLVYLLSSMTGDAYALTLAFCMRIVTTIGDGVFALSGAFLYRWSSSIAHQK